jgi:hypothetical protein
MLAAAGGRNKLTSSHRDWLGRPAPFTRAVPSDKRRVQLMTALQTPADRPPERTGADAAGVRLIDHHPLAKDADGKLLSRIATIFPDTRTIVTLPGIHATQRQAYLDVLDDERIGSGQDPLTHRERQDLWNCAVDLVMENDTILIRPDPDNMELAFLADDILTQLCSTRQVKFLYVHYDNVYEAVKRRGACWRITPLPESSGEMIQMILNSRIGIEGRRIYYYNNTTGTRFLTYHEFDRLGDLAEDERRRLLGEIQRHSARVNRMGNPEIAFFQADDSFSRRDFADLDFAGMDSARLQAVFESLRERFAAATPPGLRQDDVAVVEWRNSMFAKLIAQRNEVVSEEQMLGLSPEFYMHIKWLPGGRFENGEFILDSTFERPSPGRRQSPLCQQMLGFIFNFIREYGDLEYVNVGRVAESLARRRVARGRRDVFLAEIKPCDGQREVVKVIRMQKYGVAERLDEGQHLLRAMIESEKYTNYVLDRRLACRQLGMNILTKVTAGKIEETYAGKNDKYHGQIIWSPYFERDYVRGIATDKVPRHRFQNDDFALRFARLLGAAAAPNIIVGRNDLDGPVVFDDGDEILIEDANGLPVEILVVDQLGTFNDYKKPLESFVKAYAAPVRERREYLTCPSEFAAAYLDAFCERFARIQEEYRRRKRAFDNMFSLRPWDEGGSFPFRWDRVLQRLNRTSPAAIADAIRRHIESDE